MITRNENESRGDYLMRVAIELIRSEGEIMATAIDYDGTTCDGACLADDMETELSERS